MNPIDSCLLSDGSWSANRKKLADCSVGFGSASIGGKYGAIYTVTDPSDDPINPRPGTLRYGAIQTKPLWIIFSRSMVIKLRNELMVNSYKTIDGRGASVEIAYGPCMTIQRVSHVIVHGISVHDCRPGSPGSFSRAYDGLVDITHGSTAITISNNYFSNHDKVMLIGHKDGMPEDKAIKVTIAFNHFGSNLGQRMPRVRTGYAHVANNRYDGWQKYAIGGSSNPTIFSEGNYFFAPSNRNLKEVTKREAKGWKNWKWRSSKDLFQNGAFFVQSGWGSCAPAYSPLEKFNVAQGVMVPTLTSRAGVLRCTVGKSYA